MKRKTLFLKSLYDFKYITRMYYISRKILENPCSSIIKFALFILFKFVWFDVSKLLTINEPNSNHSMKLKSHKQFNKHPIYAFCSNYYNTIWYFDKFGLTF